MNPYRTCVSCHTARALVGQDQCLPCVHKEIAKRKKRKKRTPTFFISVSAEHHERLKQEARRKGVTMGALIGRAVANV